MFGGPSVKRLHEGRDALIDALRDDDESVRHLAALVLGKRPDTRTLEPLLAATKDPDANVRAAALAAIHMVDDSRVTSCLVLALDDDEAAVRRAAVYNLSDRGDVRALPHLVEEGIAHPNSAWLLGPMILRLGDPLDRWGAAPPGRCDLCNVPVTALDGYCVPSAEFRMLARWEYNPYARNRVSETTFTAAQLLSPDPEAAYQPWSVMAQSNTTDWALCRACALDLTDFMAHPPSFPHPCWRPEAREELEEEAPRSAPLPSAGHRVLGPIAQVPVSVKARLVDQDPSAGVGDGERRRSAQA